MSEKTVQNLGELVEGFLLSKRVAGLSSRTLDAHGYWLHRFSSAHTPEPLDVQRFFVGLRRTLKPAIVHQAYRTLKTFFRWCIDTGLWAENPLRGFAIRVAEDVAHRPYRE